MAEEREVGGFGSEFELGKREKAERAVLRSLSIMMSTVGPRHSRTVKVREFLTALYVDWGRPEQAAEQRKLIEAVAAGNQPGK